jgi:hypothetical protein
LELLLTLALLTLVALSAMTQRLDCYGVRPALSGHMIILYLFSVYGVLPAALLLLNHGQYIWASSVQEPDSFRVALTLTLGALATYLWGYHILGKESSRRLDENHRLLAHTNELDALSLPAQRRFMAILFVLLGLAFRLSSVLVSGGWRQVVLSFSGAQRKANHIDLIDPSVIILRSFSGLADIGALWLALEAYRNRRLRLPATILFALVLLSDFGTSGKRLTILLPVIAFVVGIHAYARRITIKATPLWFLLGLGAGMLSLLFRGLAPASLAGSSVDLMSVPYAQGSVWRFYFYSLEFSSLEMITVANKGAGDIAAMFGGRFQEFIQTSVTPFVYLIPRYVWPGKPTQILDQSYGISALLLGGTAQEAKVGFACTLIGTAILIVGVPGLLLIFAALGRAMAALDLRHSAKTFDNRRILLYAGALTFVFHFFRQGTLAWAFMLTVVTQLGFVVGALFLTRSAGPPRKSSTNQTNLVRPWSLHLRSCEEKISR